MSKEQLTPYREYVKHLVLKYSGCEESGFIFQHIKKPHNQTKPKTPIKKPKQNKQKTTTKMPPNQHIGIHHKFVFLILLREFSSTYFLLAP